MRDHGGHERPLGRFPALASPTVSKQLSNRTASRLCARSTDRAVASGANTSSLLLIADFIAGSGGSGRATSPSIASRDWPQDGRRDGRGPGEMGSPTDALTPLFGARSDASSREEGHNGA